MPEEMDPKKYHVLTPQKKKKFILAVAIFMLIVLPPFAYKYYRFAIFRPSQSDKEVTIEILKGEGVPEISRALYRAGAINSEFLFNAYVFLNRYDNNLQAGTYKIYAGTNMVDVVDMLQHGKDDISITFLEGWRTEEYTKKLVENFKNIDHEEFFIMAKQYEGYLFPDTYNFSKEVQEEEVFGLLTATFQTKTQDILTDENLRKAGLSKEDAVIFASIIEREIRDEEDKAIVAGILIKRWQEDMKLDADATTQYAASSKRICSNSGESYESDPACVPSLQDLKEVVWWPRELTMSDIDLDSVYNTRKNVGLPPAPIANPGLDSINAVLNYVPTQYYYYLTDSSGKTHYARTLDEHNRNISLYLAN
jgi:UPF0755 protein